MKNLFLYICLFFQLNICVSQKTLLVVGTYTDSKPMKGIHIYDFNVGNGKAKEISTGEDLINPSFLTISSDGRYIYACTESRIANGGNLSVFAFDRNQKTITLTDKKTSGGENPAHVSITPDGNFAFVSNYNAGSLSVYKVNQGKIDLLQTLIFTGNSIHPKRQEKPHLHSTYLSPDGKYVFAPDLGTDKIRVFSFDAKSDLPLKELPQLTVNTMAGSGPRHMVIHPNNKFIYCAEELSGRVVAYKYKKGRLYAIKSYDTYKSKFEEYSTADLHCSPDGKFLYVSNRLEGENSIAIFKINNKNGELNLIRHESTHGNQPRNFAIDPSGNFLLVGNVLTNNIVVFHRDKKTGLLSKVDELDIFNPACLNFFTVP
jgi:6-phosphogluconolactonase (cycloisomerase 2 family)